MGNGRSGGTRRGGREMGQKRRCRRREKREKEGALVRARTGWGKRMVREEGKAGDRSSKRGGRVGEKKRGVG